jgi:dynein heavy chain
MLKFSNFLSNLTMAVGQARGQTLLPYPPPEAFDEDNLPEKERVHLLETSVVQWANRIQAVLATDPDAALKDGSNPDPESEIQFWEAKGKNLESLHEQLNSAKMKSVLETLSEMQSPFSAQFEKLTKDVADAGAEAKDNNKYLKTLDRYFGAINASLDFATLPENYLPLLHTMLLVWQHSKTYNNQQRLACLIQELCNSLINNASNFVNGEAIFRFIEDESVGEAVQLLASTLDIIGQFKTMFRVYQEKAAKVLPEGAWDVPDELLFGRLDLFLERCHDIQEFTSIVVEFTKLEKISLGGTKGQELTDTLQGVFRDFNSAVHTFQHVPYDIMDVSVVRFDEDFYRFRCNIKELEVRLSAIIISSFDDQATIQAKFHLLDAFEGLVERPSIKDELDKRTGVLLSSYMDDLTTVQNMFHQHKDSPRIDNNMPPIAGALQWCRGLLERIKAPMEDLRHFMGHSDREEIKDIEKIYESLTIKLQKFESEHIAEWTREIDQTSQNNLMKSLLKRDKETRRLGVNFDMALVRLLREVKYFLNPLALEVPPNALAIFSKAKMYRVQIGNLEMIVHMYNDMMDTLHMVERPLVEKEMAHIDETLEKGIAELNWKSPEIDVFLKEAMETVKSVFQTVKIMKDNFATIKKIMSEYAKVPLADRKNKPQSPADFEDHLKKLWATRHTVISEHQETVTKLLTETNQALKVNKGSPIWRAYVEYVQDHVRDGLAFTIVNSIRFICDQLDQASIEKNDLPPLLEIKLGLYANDVLFNAEDGVSGLDEKAPRKSRRDVWQIVNDWVEGFFEIGNIMTRMDGSHYVGDLKKNEGIVRFINTLKKHLDWNQKECESYRQEYIKFEFLWKTDRNTEFYKFLQNAVNPPKAGEDEGTEEPKEGEEKKEKKKTDMPDILPLAKFEEKIQFYKDLQAEVAEKKSPVQIGWLKINSSVIKSALTTWVSRWVETYTSFLYNDVARKLSQMENLITTVDEGLQREVKPGDSEALKAVLGHIHQVRSQEKMGAKMFAPLRECVALLKKHDRNLEDYELKLLADMPIKWDTTVNQVYKIKEKVNSLQNTEVENIKEKVEQFDQGLLKFRELYKKEAPFTYEYGVNAAYETINIWHGKIHAMETEASKLVDLEEVFELNVSKHQEIKANRLENKQLKQMWDMISLTKHSFNDWKKTLWDDIDSDALIAKCKNLQKQTSLMPKDIRGWKVFIGLQDEIKNLMTVLPLVSLLHSPCMMERHWRELKQSTGKDFDKDNDFSLADLLALELHNYVPIVEYIVELANKENKISGQLEKIEETW